jgi:hypothetical protein
VRMQITKDDHIQIAIADGVMVPVEHLGISQHFISGEAATRISLRETYDRASKMELNLLWVTANRLIGTVRAESIGDLPQFGLPLYVSLSKH